MYAARIDGTPYTFQASGALWQDALVLQDLQTESLWSQVTGQAIKGPLKGTQLQQLPSLYMTFAEFTEQYPEGVLLRKPSKGRSGSHYGGYFADRDRLGIFGRRNSFERLDGKDRVVGLRLPSGPLAVSLTYLMKHRFALVGDDIRVLVTFKADGKATGAYKLPSGVKVDALTVADERLTITIPDGNEPLVWDLATGRAIGHEQGNLEQFPITTAFWFAWVSFFPGTELLK